MFSAPNIVVIRAGALGDVLLTLPALHTLRSRYPDAALRVVGYPSAWEVAEPLVDEITSIDLPMFAGLYSGEPSDALRDWLGDTALAVAWTARDPRAALWRSGVPSVIHAPPLPPPGFHAAGWLVETLSVGSLTCEVRTASLEDAVAWSMHLTEQERTEARERLVSLGLDRPVLLHPGAGAAWKRWPAERFGAVGEALHRQGFQVALVKGPTDAEAIETAQASVRDPFPLILEPSTRKLGGLLSWAALYIGNDSGVTHLAAAAGALVIALFGPTDPATWAPLGNSRVLRACTSSSEAQSQIRVCEDPRCLEGITVEDVVAASFSSLREGSAARKSG